MESNGSIIYEWQDNNEVRFRVVIDKIKIKDVQKKTRERVTRVRLYPPPISLL